MCAPPVSVCTTEKVKDELTMTENISSLLATERRDLPLSPPAYLPTSSSCRPSPVFVSADVADILQAFPKKKRKKTGNMKKIKTYDSKNYITTFRAQKF